MDPVLNQPEVGAHHNMYFINVTAQTVTYVLNDIKRIIYLNFNKHMKY